MADLYVYFYTIPYDTVDKKPILRIYKSNYSLDIFKTEYGKIFDILVSMDGRILSNSTTLLHANITEAQLAHLMLHL